MEFKFWYEILKCSFILFSIYFIILEILILYFIWFYKTDFYKWNNRFYNKHCKFYILLNLKQTKYLKI